MKIPLLITALILGTAPAQAADKADVARARETFTKDEAALNKVLDAACDTLDKAKAAALRKKEAAWIEFRDERSAAKAKAAGNTESPKLSLDYWQTMIAYTEERAEFLKTYTGKNVSQGINGDYTDSVDGDLQLEERKEGLFFTFSVVRGNTLQAGQLTGIAQRKGNKAHFKGDAEDGKKACELEFTFIDGHIVRVEEISPDPDAGKGVHYDGDYYKKADSVIHD